MVRAARSRPSMRTVRRRQTASCTCRDVSSENRAAADLQRTAKFVARQINASSQPGQRVDDTIGQRQGYYADRGCSRNPSSIIDATVKPGDLPVRDIWPDGGARADLYLQRVGARLRFSPGGSATERCGSAIHRDLPDDQLPLR
jgi:hypothetical protein